MRLLLAVHGFPPREQGGAERRAERTAVGLAQRGHRVAVMVSSPGPGDEVTLRDHAGVHVLRRNWPLLGPGDPFEWSYDRPDRLQLAARAQALGRPDVLHVFGGYGTTAAPVKTALEAKIPVVVSLTDYWWICERMTLVRSDGRRCDGPNALACGRCHAEMSRRYRWLARAFPLPADWFWRMGEAGHGPGSRHVEAQRRRHAELVSVLNRCAAMIAPSQFIASVHARFGVDPSRLVIARQGVTQVPRVRRRASDGTLRVGYLGQVKWHKGVDLLLDAWARLRGDRPRQLSLWGDAAGEAKYAATIRNRITGMHGVRWEGAIEGDEVWAVLGDLDLVVLASRWPENSPNVILEAQAMGLPVVAPRLGGIPEMITHEDNGLLAEPESAAGLALQLQRLLDEPELLSHLTARARRPRTFDEELDDLEAVYRRVSVAS